MSIAEQFVPLAFIVLLQLCRKRSNTKFPHIALLHQAAALRHCPFPQGIDVIESERNFRTWFSDCAYRIGLDQKIPWMFRYSLL